MKTDLKTAGSAGGKKTLFTWIKELRELNLLLVIIVAGIILSFTSPYFLTHMNIKVILASIADQGIVVIGMTLILIVGGIDLSVGAVLCLSAAISSLLILAGVNPWIALLIAVASASLIGLIMGLLVTKLDLSHFIVTLAFMGITRGIVAIITSGTPISLVAELDVPRMAAFKFLGQGSIGLLTMPVVLFLILAVIGDFLVRNSAAMRIVFYTGSNEKAATYSGINTKLVKIIIGMICSALAGLAGVIYSIKFSGVPMSAGEGFEMTTISAAVIGGASLTGGRGSILGSVLGLMLMAIVTDAMTLFTVPPFYQNFIRFTILLLAVVIDHFQQKSAKAKI